LAKLAANKSRNNRRLAGFLIVLFVIIVSVVSVNSGNQTPNPTTPPKLTTQEDSCRSDWTKCDDNEQLVNHYSDWSHVKVDCKQAANDRAKYGNPNWPWFPFGTFVTGKNYVTSGIAVAVEPDAQFSNGFGGMVHSRITCTYDLRAKRVTNVDISAR
jgi:hypothetical protein